MSTYSADVLATSGLLYYWQFTEPSGTTATDSQGSNTGTYQGTVTLGQTGFPGESPDTAVLLDGSTGWVSTTTPTASPGPLAPFTLECWFKTTSVTGGGLVQFRSEQTSTAGGSGFNDRQIWMEDSGKLRFAIWTGAETVIVSTAAYNDGNWHHVAGVIAASNNMALYVDGASVASNSNTTAPQAFNGYWRVGHTANMAGWTNPPTNNFLAGTMAQAAIYSTDLSGATVLDHYTVGTAAQQFIHTFNAIPFMGGH